MIFSLLSVVQFKSKKFVTEELRRQEEERLAEMRTPSCEQHQELYGKDKVTNLSDDASCLCLCVPLSVSAPGCTHLC